MPRLRQPVSEREERADLRYPDVSPDLHARFPSYRLGRRRQERPRDKRGRRPPPAATVRAKFQQPSVARNDRLPPRP